jgi:hypothetical protein
MPVMPDFQPPYTLLFIKTASPSSQLPKIVSSLEDAKASTTAFTIYSAVKIFFARNRYGFFFAKTCSSLRVSSLSIRSL